MAADGAVRRAPVPPIDVDPTVPALLRRAVARFGDDPFVLTAKGTTTFADVDDGARRLAMHLLARGVGKGSRVAFLLAQGPSWIETFLAITRIGAIALPLSTFSTPAEIRRCLRLGDASHWLLPPALLDNDMLAFAEATVEGLAGAQAPALYTRELPFLRTVLITGPTTRAWATTVDLEGVAVSGPDAAFLEAVESEVVPADHLVTLFTSGTTSGPKGVVHTHGAQVRHVANIAAFRGMKPSDRFFTVSPFFWVAGLTFQVLPALYVGSSLVCQERFEPGAALDLIERTKPNQYLGWPNALARLRDHPTFGRRRFAGIPWLVPPEGTPADPARRHSGMGMTETSGNHTIAPASEIDRVLPDDLRGAFGTAVPYVQHKIIDPETDEVLPPGVEGEICIRGYSVMVGYAKREREDVFDIDGWFHTGDRGYFRDGYLFFTGRANDMIKTAGSNVSPREVEEVLAELPEVKLGLVLGLPDLQRGEIVVIGVVPQEHQVIDPATVRSYLRSKLSGYKVPREDSHVVALAEGDIPFINGAKPDRKVARRLVADRLGRSVDPVQPSVPQ